MMTKVLVLECDFCSTEGDGVQTRNISGTSGVLELEACEKCWEKKTRAIMPKARRIRRRSPKRRAA